MSQRQDFFRGVGRNRRQSCALQDWNVGHVVAHIGRLFGSYTVFCENFFPGVCFESFALLDARDTEFFGSRRRLCGNASGEDGNRDSRSLQHFDAQTVAGVETLDEFAVFTRPNRPIGEHPVNIQYNQTNGGCASKQICH